MPSSTYVRHGGNFESDTAYRQYKTALSREQIGVMYTKALTLIGELSKMRENVITGYNGLKDQNSLAGEAETALVTKLGGIGEYAKLKTNNEDTFLTMLHDIRSNIQFQRTNKYNSDRNAYIARKKALEKYEAFDILDMRIEDVLNNPVMPRKAIEKIKAGQPWVETSESARQIIEEFELEKISPYVSQTMVGGDDLPVALPISSTQGKSKEEASAINARLSEELGLRPRHDKHGEIHVGAPASFEKDSWVGSIVRSMQLGRGSMAGAATLAEGYKSFGAQRPLVRPKDYPVWNPPDDWDPTKEPWIKDVKHPWSIGGLAFTKIPRAFFTDPKRKAMLVDNMVYDMTTAMDTVDPLHVKDAAYKLRSYFASLEDMIRGDLMVQLENGFIDADDLPKLYSYYMEQNVAKDIAHYISPKVIQFFGEMGLDFSNYVFGPLYRGGKSVAAAVGRRVPEGKFFDDLRGINNLNWFKFLRGNFDASMYPKITEKGKEFLLRSRQKGVEGGSGAVQDYIDALPDLLGRVRSAVITQVDQDMIVDAVNGVNKYAEPDVKGFVESVFKTMNPKNAQEYLNNVLKDKTDAELMQFLRKQMLPEKMRDAYDALIQYAALKDKAAVQSGVLNMIEKKKGKLASGGIDPQKRGVIFRKDSLDDYLANRGLITSTEFKDGLPFLAKLDYVYTKVKDNLKAGSKDIRTIPSSALPRKGADKYRVQVKNALKATVADIKDFMPKAQLADQGRKIVDSAEEMGAVVRIELGPYTTSTLKKMGTALDKQLARWGIKKDKAVDAVEEAKTELKNFIGERRKAIEGLHDNLRMRTNISIPDLNQFIFNTEQNIGLYLARKKQGLEPPKIFNYEFTNETLKDFQAYITKQAKLEKKIATRQKKVADIDLELGKIGTRIDEATEHYRTAAYAESKARVSLANLEAEYGMKYHAFNTAELVDTTTRAATQGGIGVSETIPEFLVRITGKPVNKLLGHEIILVPDPIYKHAALSVSAGFIQGLPLHTIFRAGGKVGMQIVKNHNKLWRALHTGVSTGYFLRDLATLPGFAFVAHGMKALNPKMHINTAKAAFLASYGGKSHRALKQTFRTLPDGTKLTYGKLLEIARNSKFLDEFDIELRSALKEGGEGVVSDFIDRTLRADFEGIAKMMGKEMDEKTAKALRAFLTGGMVVGLGALPPHVGRAIGQIISNHQKLLGLGWFLKGLDEKSIAEAVEKTGAYFGHYAKASNFEKAVLQDLFTFWNFTKFTGAYLPEMLIKHPDRMAVFQRMYNFYKNENAKYAPVTSEGYPGMMRASMYPAPAAFQSEWTKKFVDSTERPKPGTEEFTMMMMNSPLHLGMYVAELVDMKIGTPEANREIVRMLTPLTQMFLSVIGMYDYKGDDLSKSPIFPDFTEGDWQAFRQSFGDSVFGRILASPFGRLSRTYKGLIETTRTVPGVQADHMWRLTLHNFRGHMNKTLLQMFSPGTKMGEDDPEIGFMDVLFNSGSAAMQLRPYMHQLNILRKISEIPSYERQLQRAGEGF